MIAFKIETMILLASFLMLTALKPAQGQQSCSADKQRLQEAEHLITQARSFKQEARRFHDSVSTQSKDAGKLLIAAKKLDKSTRKLNASIEQNVKAGGVFRPKNRDYELHVSEFKKHSSLYNAHLANYEKEVQKLEASQRQLRSSCQEYADHSQRYHIPGLRPPHICLQLQWEQNDMQKVVKGYQEDQLKVQKAETALAAQEAKLAQAAQEHAELESRMLKQAEFDELERTQGVMLLKEYQQIEREYRTLESEKKSLPRR